MSGRRTPKGARYRLNSSDSRFLRTYRQTIANRYQIRAVNVEINTATLISFENQSEPTRKKAVIMLENRRAAFGVLFEG